MHPCSKRGAHVARDLNGDLIVLGQHHDVHRLGPVAAYVWRHADGSRSVAALTEGVRATVDASADAEVVYEALDRLADAGLLQARLTPPAGVSRRATLQRLVGASALAALTAVLGRAGLAEAKGDTSEAGGLCADDKALIAEIAWLVEQESAVAALLDEWTDAAETADDSDPFYVDALGAREASRKKGAEALEADLDASTDDLADCLLAKKTPAYGDREHLRKASASKRLDLHRQRLSERRYKVKKRADSRELRTVQSEKMRKAQVHQHAEHQSKKVAGDAGWDADAALEALRHREKRAKYHIKRATYHRVAQIDGQGEDAEQRYKDFVASAQLRQLAMEKAAKRRAQFVKEREQEQSHKALAGSDYVLEVASADAAAAKEEALLARKQEMAEKSAEKAKEELYKEAELAKERNLKHDDKAQEENFKVQEKASEKEQKVASEMKTKA